MEWKLGLKSGAVAGAIYGVLAGIIGLVYLIVMKEEVIQRIQAAIPSDVNIPISMEQLYTITLISSFPSGIVMGVIVGMVFGIIFLLLHDEWPGKTPRRQGLFLALFLFLFFGIAEMFSPENAAGGFFMLRFSYLPLIPFSFAAFLFFGYCLGMFWERFEKKPKR